MSKRFTKFKTSYIISRVEPCEGHWTQYYIGEDVNHRGSNWTTYRGDAKKYDNPIAAASAITIHNLTDAKVETSEIIGKETFVKEETMNKQFKRYSSTFVIKRVDPSVGMHYEYYTGDWVRRWSENPEEAKVYDNPIEARTVINCEHLHDAEVYARPISGEERFKEENAMNEDKVYGTGTHVFVKSEQYSAPGARIVRKIVDYREKTDEYVAIDANGKYYSVPSYEIIEPVTSDGIISAFEKRLKKHQDDTFMNFYCAADVLATAELIRNMYKVKKEKNTMLPEIKKVIFNKPATIILWADDTKTVVKCQEGEIYDPEKGLSMAIAKKALGNNYEYYNTIKHWLKKAPKVETSRFYCNGVEYTSTKAGE